MARALVSRRFARLSSKEKGVEYAFAAALDHPARLARGGGCAPQPRTEVGTHDGAHFRIDIPERWNQKLVVYLHGYTREPPTFDASAPTAFQRVFLDRGYAFLQSSYSAGGWSIRQSIDDTEALRRRFADQHGKPDATYLVGHSMGGFSPC